MDWDKLRDEWRHDVPVVHPVAIEELRALDGTLWKKVRRRDLVETVAAVSGAVAFGLFTISALVDGEWLQAAFALLVTAWSIALPFQLRRSRPVTAAGDHAVSMLDYLRCQRDAALAQARMLERVWLWYLAPPVIGIAGFRLATDGVNAGSLGYLGVLLLMCAGIAWLNHHAAQTKFRAHAAVLQRQIDALAGSGD